MTPNFTMPVSRMKMMKESFKKQLSRQNKLLFDGAEKKTKKIKRLKSSNETI
jgi:hypothetical protein